MIKNNEICQRDDETCQRGEAKKKPPATALHALRSPSSNRKSGSVSSLALCCMCTHGTVLPNRPHTSFQRQQKIHLLPFGRTAVRTMGPFLLSSNSTPSSYDKDPSRTSSTWRRVSPALIPAAFPERGGGGGTNEHNICVHAREKTAANHVTNKITTNDDSDDNGDQHRRK